MWLIAVCCLLVLMCAIALGSMFCFGGFELLVGGLFCGCYCVLVFGLMLGTCIIWFV